LARETKKILTAEDHQIKGGMGSAVAEVLAKKYPTLMDFVGVDDRFGQSGTPEELENLYGLDTESIIEKIKKLINQKVN
jgi:transketolase